MSFDEATTWLLVSTSPDDEITMPVPAASPPLSVLTRLTTDGLIFWAIDCTSMLACWPLLDELPELPFDEEPVLGSYCGICDEGNALDALVESVPLLLAPMV